MDHSTILHDYFEEMDDEEGKGYDIVERESFSALSDKQWKLLKALVEQDESVFEYGSSGTPYLNSGKGYTLEMLKNLLDYLDYDKPTTMMGSITKYAKNFRGKMGHGVTGATRGALKKKANANRAHAQMLRENDVARAAWRNQQGRIARWRMQHGIPNNNNGPNNNNDDDDEEILKEIEEEEAVAREAAKAEALRVRLRKSQKAKKYAPVNANTAVRAKPLGRKSTLKRYNEKRLNKSHMLRGKTGKRGKTSKRERGSKKGMNNTNLIAEFNNINA